MTTQNYLIIESGVVTNIVMWDGNTTTWTPPTGSIQLVQATTPAKVWEEVLVTIDNKPTFEWQLVEKLNAQDTVGFTWDGTILNTNQPKPMPFDPMSFAPKT